MHQSKDKCLVSDQVLLHIPKYIHTYIHTHTLYNCPLCMHQSKDKCLVSDQVLLSFLSGDKGGTCASGTLGEKAIRTATQNLDGARNFWYAPDTSVKVRPSLSCVSPLRSTCVSSQYLPVILPFWYTPDTFVKVRPWLSLCLLFKVYSFLFSISASDTGLSAPL